ncbi:MAG: Asp-tRNA(Asn)/Glu-tRNA(Gln) amidotransferase GatCAB subunit B [Myxococcales bacterium]|nr:Asp-tRNA(Asn)/Glu-tRNA(Gln) amidotransferase GatCAB subunit B [Myxococcales bacterium]
MSSSEWEAVIGLEVHAQLKTSSKLFSRESAQYGAEPNTQVNEVCAGMPGALPVINERAVEYAMVAGYALGCEVHLWSQFARKNYFYPDLPKGYQISQFKHPICTGGGVDYLLDGELKRCNLTRIHLEEDAGKNIHAPNGSLVDLNRAGVPLIEIVGEPELRSADEATAYLKELRNILRYLDVCDGNLEEGSFRCDANVSVRPRGQEAFGTRAELKNINSFRFIQRAIDYEIARQIDLLENGEQVVQETRLFNHDTGRTTSMRSKEEAHDYRYFPDPDLPPLVIAPEWSERVKAALPELPGQKRERYQRDLGLPAYDADVLTQARPVAEFFEAAVAAHDNPKGIANWVMNEVLREVDNPEEGLDALAFGPAQLAELVQMVDDKELTGKIAKAVFAKMVESGQAPTEIADAEGLRPIRDEGRLRALIADILANNPAQVEQFRGGKTKLMGFFIGQLMQQTRGKADPGLGRKLLMEELNSDNEDG